MQLITNFSKWETNLIFNLGKLLFYDSFQNLPIKCVKMPENEAKLVKISILNLSEVLSVKVTENRPPPKIKVSATFSESAS